jgi:hypothetical protein
VSQPTQPTYDSIWKALPDEVILALVRLVVPGIGPKLTPWKTDIKVVFDRDLDNAYLVTLNGVTAILLLEYQNYLDATMPLRIYHYVSLLKLQYFQLHQRDIVVIPIVIWAIPGTIPSPVYESSAGTTVGIVSRYYDIRLSEMDWHGVEPLLLVLAPYLHGFQPDDLETAAIQMYEATPPEYRLLLLGALLTISKRKYKDIDEIEQAILQKVRLTLDEIFEAIAEGPFGVKLIERGKAQGIAEGKAQGLAEGEAKGKAEGEAKGKAQGIAEGAAKGEVRGLQEAVTMLWRGRFGEVSEEVSAALEQASLKQLQRLLEAFAHNAPEAEIRAQLSV